MHDSYPSIATRNNTAGATENATQVGQLPGTVFLTAREEITRA